MSPQSRRSQPPAAATPPPNALFAEMLRAARELLAVRSPLDAELMVSELLGTWWGQRSVRGTGVEQLIGEGLVDYAAGQRSPAALALLSGIACLGTPRQAAKAERAALELMECGVPCPGWAAHLGEVTPAECYVNPDAFGDQDEIICVFSYAGEEPHALVSVVDYNAGGMIRDGWVTSRVSKLLDHCREASAQRGAEGRHAFREVDAPQARRMLEAALRVTDAQVSSVSGFAGLALSGSGSGGSGPGGSGPGGSGPGGSGGTGPGGSGSGGSRSAGSRSGSSRSGSSRSGGSGLGGSASLGGSAAGVPGILGASVSESFPSYHAFIRARVRALPPYRGRSALSATGPRRQAWSKDRRAMLAAEFLASDEAEDLSDRSAASHCADRIIDYGCDRDFARPLRMSPTKVEAFLLGWLPRKVMLSYAEQDAMPHVLAAWVRWAGRRRGLGEPLVAETLEAVFNSMGTFAAAYRDPAEFGLEYALVRRLLPDGDLEALPRRAFAFPVLEGWHAGVDLSALDPADPNDRRALLTADHATPAPGGVGRHIERHLLLADRLWRNDPPELWETAQRLLDGGQERHLVLHALMAVLDRVGDNNPAALIAALEDLEID